MKIELIKIIMDIIMCVLGVVNMCKFANASKKHDYENMLRWGIWAVIAFVLSGL